MAETLQPVERITFSQPPNCPGCEAQKWTQMGSTLECDYSGNQLTINGEPQLLQLPVENSLQPHEQAQDTREKPTDDDIGCYVGFLLLSAPVICGIITLLDK